MANDIPTLTSFIYIVKKALAHSVCDKIILEYVDDSDWSEWNYKNKDNILSVNNCRVFNISSEHTISKNKVIRQSIDDTLYQCFSKSIKEYCTQFNCEISSDTGYNLLEYTNGGYFNTHIDTMNNLNNRYLSCSLLLSDDFKGGDFSFFNDKYKVSLSKGDMIIFPSNFMYPHGITKITGNNRYSIITWFN
jgi:predicted 2-oxoglutarate/Fe(II)-dependent dioxygenase YbiX